MQSRTLVPLAVLALVACATQNTREPVSTTTTRSALVTEAPVTATASRPTIDERLFEPAAPMAQKFHDALAANPELAGVPWKHLQIDETDGHVTIRGRIPTSADAVQVEMTIRQMKGVTAVTNGIRPYR